MTKVDPDALAEAVLSDGTFASVRTTRAYQFLVLRKAIEQSSSKEEVELLCISHLVSFDDEKLSMKQILNLPIQDYLICAKLAADQVKSILRNVNK